MTHRLLVAALTGTIALVLAGPATAWPRDLLAAWHAPFEPRALAQAGVACHGVQPTILGTEGDDLINGTPGDDVIHGLGGNDTIDGAGGHDLICGGEGNDTLLGGAGHDALSGDAGDDVVDGGPGTDLAVYLEAPGPVSVNLASGGANGDGIDILLAIEAVLGSPFADELRGNGAPNYLDGDAGNDLLEGLGGNDILDGGPGNDVMRGGRGFDEVRYTFAPRAVTVNLKKRRATGWGTDTLNTIEDVMGSRFADRLTGNAAGNWLYGGPGNDVLKGLGGNDRLFGQRGNDRLFGGAGRDILDGGVGKQDAADGGPGRDRCVRVKTKVRCEL